MKATARAALRIGLLGAMASACGSQSPGAAPGAAGEADAASGAADGTAATDQAAATADGSTAVSPEASSATDGAVPPPNLDATAEAMRPPVTIDAGGADGAALDSSAPTDAAVAADANPSDAPAFVCPPVPDTASTYGISAPGAGYKVEGNLPYGPLPAQRLDVMYPVGAGPGGTKTLPGVIMFHGGGWTDNRPAALKASMSSFFDRFLAHGYLVANVEYRLADGTANGAIAPAAVQDALLAAKWFWDAMDCYHVDKTRYVVTGGSAGGHLALMVGMATPAAQLGPTSPNDYEIAAIVNGYGPSDVADLLARNVSWAVQWLPANTPNRDAIAQQVSPITYVRKDIPPLLTVQGADDTTVPTAQSQNLYNLLQAAGAVTELHFVAGAGHGFSTPATAWPDAEATIFAFLTAQGL